jgi:hypothetical protein
MVCCKEPARFFFTINHSGDGISANPHFKEMSSLIDKNFAGTFLKTIGKDETTEEFNCTMLMKVFELEKNFYNPNLDNSQIEEIFGYLQANFPGCIEEQEENLFGFDFHLLGWDEVECVNRWFSEMKFGLKKKFDK